MATVGLKDLYYSPITESNGSETYGTPARLAKAISAELSVETTTAELYADDALDEEVREFSKGELKLNINDLADAAAVALFGAKKDSADVVLSNALDNPPEVAVGFRAKKSSGKYRYVWLYRVKFGVPSESYQTKGESIEFKTPEITGTILKRKSDGRWKADYTGAETDAVAAAWFNSVYETASTGTGGATT